MISFSTCPTSPEETGESGRIDREKEEDGRGLDGVSKIGEWQEVYGSGCKRPKQRHKHVGFSTTRYIFSTSPPTLPTRNSRSPSNFAGSGRMT
ncbi:hypothetical protein L5515_002960 [Caenorhabditis briggsae]|uniref:Uncharacterized protein n=1 Tax=Caenorhabditis briggsae TaxID=6238 RepID=A0AAE9J9P0_CAEBR|nr:hypothetical protein L5515_002960 [Caenorhabditis briggsae]